MNIVVNFVKNGYVIRRFNLLEIIRVNLQQFTTVVPAI